jgi:hypothetical protein
MNQTGAGMLGVDRDHAYGLPLGAFMDADSAVQFSSAMARLDAGVNRTSCTLQLFPRNGPQASVLASLAKDPAAPRHLVNLSYAETGQKQRP